MRLVDGRTEYLVSMGIRAVSYTHLDVYKRQTDRLTPMQSSERTTVQCTDRVVSLYLTFCQ